MSSLKLFQNKLALDCFYNEKELAKEIKDGKWNKLHKVWTYPCNKTKLTQLKNTFPNIYISPEVEIKVKEVEEIRQRALVLKTLNDYDLDCSFLKTQPYNFQKVGIAFMLNQDCCMNFDDLGAGKTLMAITTAIIRKQRGEVKRALIICPVSMKQVWKQEIEKHSYEKAMVVEGNKIKRLKIYEEFKESNCLFLVVNFETIRSDINIFKDIYEKN